MPRVRIGRWSTSRYPDEQRTKNEARRDEARQDKMEIWHETTGDDKAMSDDHKVRASQE